MTQCLRLGERERTEPDEIAGFQLPHLPKFCFDGGRRTNEATEAGAVWTKNDRHVSGEVDGADRISVVVNVRRMKSGFAAVFARPARFRSNQAHACAVGVVMYLPGGREKYLDVFGGKKIGGTMGAVEDSDFPLAAIDRNGARSEWAEFGRSGISVVQVQHVTAAHRAS